ncbi:uncharacterized protein BDV14DRAFT_180823 [Aspergillus stella-maris]|uniref:uncharacterized protein n=1 Tax=Aspergillus stella-maris TaxID=1810926 RepID=UPI003CCCB6A4
MVGVGGFAQPDQPIHVTMASDEERFTGGRQPAVVKITAPPPAYGVWRSSVVSNSDTMTNDMFC